MKGFLKEKIAIGIIIFLSSFMFFCYREEYNIIKKIIGVAFFIFSYFLVILIVVKIEKSKNYIDYLTDVYTKEKLFKDIEKRLRLKDNFKVIYIDLDDFKKLNDNFGHLVGDKFLKEFTQKLKSYKYDNIYRYGGDEFVIVTNNEQEKIFENMMKIMNSNGYNFSFGVSSSNEFEADSLNLKQLTIEILKVADKRMYENKKEKSSRV